MKYIIDTDPGIDDAVAIMMGYLNGLDIVGFTLAQGNIKIDNSLRNLKVVEDMLGSDIKIYKSKQLENIDYELASYAHGKNGLGDIATPKSERRVSRMSAEDFIVEAAHTYDKLTIVCFGPLTNLANAIKQDKTIVDKISRVVIMGISYNAKSKELYHEFNLSVNPEAAKEVLKAGFKNIRIITHEAGVAAWIEKDYLESLRKSKNKISRFIGRITHRYMKFSKKHYNVEGFTAADPLTMAAILNGKIVRYKPCKIKVDLINRGVSKVKLVDESNIKISTGINLKEFRKTFKETFKE